MVVGYIISTLAMHQDPSSLRFFKMDYFYKLDPHPAYWRVTSIIMSTIVLSSEPLEYILVHLFMNCFPRLLMGVLSALAVDSAESPR